MANTWKLIRDLLTAIKELDMTTAAEGGSWGIYRGHDEVRAWADGGYPIVEPDASTDAGALLVLIDQQLEADNVLAEPAMRHAVMLMEEHAMSLELLDKLRKLRREAAKEGTGDDAPHNGADSKSAIRARGECYGYNEAFIGLRDILSRTWATPDGKRSESIRHKPPEVNDDTS